MARNSRCGGVGGRLQGLGGAMEMVVLMGMVGLVRGASNDEAVEEKAQSWNLVSFPCRAAHWLCDVRS
eukprot:2502215-Rhodomonas_salina.4